MTGKRILVLDDGVASVQLLKSILLNEGHNVRGASTCVDARAVVRDFSPEVLIADFDLKDLDDGVDMARELTQKLPGLMVIFTTARPITVEQRAWPVEYQAILDKPLDLDRLFKFLQ